MSLMMMPPSGFVDEFADQVAYNLKFNLASSGKPLVENFPKVAATTFALPSNFATEYDEDLDLVGFFPSKISKYVQFNYSGSNITYIHPNANITREFWVKKTQQSGGILFSSDYYGKNFDLGVADIHYDINPFFRIHTDNTATAYDRGFPASDYPYNKLVHIAFTFNSSSKKFTIWVNGKKAGNDIVRNFPNNGNHMTIGCNSWNNPGNFFDGGIFGIRFTSAVRYTENFTPPPLPQL